MPKTHATVSPFHALQAPGRLLILPNAWDAGSAAVVVACGAEAVATTSAGLSWSRGYPDGNALPRRVLEAAIADIVRAISVPLSVDVEGGYTDDASGVGELVAIVAGAGATGVNLEDGRGAPDLLCKKIEAAKAAAGRAGVDVFINARTDVYLQRLVPAERALATTLERARLYRQAGCDGVFVPGIVTMDDIRAVVAGVDGVPINVLTWQGLPPVADLRDLGVRRLSAGSSIAAAAYGRARRLATELLRDGRSEPAFDDVIAYPEMNALFAGR